jgi:sugar/nucleoside kinase (ribokinase family)
MSLLVTGSIGIDTVTTPTGRAPDVLGGSSIYFALSASVFSPVKLVGVVGEDFDDAMLEPLRRRGNIDLSGIEVRKGSETFRWHGAYEGAMNEAHTLDVQLNVLAEAGATIPDAFTDCRFVFLANTHPALQREMAQKMSSADLIVCDTMNLWIENERDALCKTLSCVQGLVLNEGEARMLTDQSNLVTAGRHILDLGPQFVVIKKGEHGSMLVSRQGVFLMPPYPTEKVVDPTGCGDSFAGGFMGYLASLGRFEHDDLKAAMARGSVMGSFVIESFSVDVLASVTKKEVDQRLSELIRMSQFA